MKKYAILSLMAVLALGACDDDDDPNGNPGTAQVRIVNATQMPTGTANNFAMINAFTGTGSGTQVGGNVAAGQGSACTTTTVPAGARRVNFRTPGSPTENAVINSYNFVGGQRYTILFYGTNTTPKSVIIQDEPTQTNATAGNRRVRIINATTGTQNYDVYARTTATGSPAANTVTASNFAPGTAASSGGSNYITVPTANNIFQIYNAGSTTTAVRTFTLDAANVPASGNVTIVFTDNGAYVIPNCS